MADMPIAGKLFARPFKEHLGLFPAHRRRSFEKIVDRVAVLQVIEKHLQTGHEYPQNTAHRSCGRDRPR